MPELVWSEWIPFAEALAHAPRQPGVYMAREGDDGEIVYIGKAGERSGGGKPQGIRGRLAIYASGKGLASGLGEAVFDRALADVEWVRARLVELEAVGPRRAKHWGIEAFVRSDLRIRWTTTPDKATAAQLEDRLVRAAGATLWNKASARLTTTVQRAAQMRPTGSGIAPSSQSGAVVATQRVTAADLSAGQIRIPVAQKHLFPQDRVLLTIVLRGETVNCSWNPNAQRSGLLKPTDAVLRRLVAPDERLTIAIHEGQVVLQ